MAIEQKEINRLIHFDPEQEGFGNQTDFGIVDGYSLEHGLFSFYRRMLEPPRRLTTEKTTQPVLAMVRRAENGKTQVITFAYPEDVVSREPLALAALSQLDALKMRRSWRVLIGGKEKEVKYG